MPGLANLYQSSDQFFLKTNFVKGCYLWESCLALCIFIGKIKQLTKKPNQKFSVLNTEIHHDLLLDSCIPLAEGLTG